MNVAALIAPAILAVFEPAVWSVKLYTDGLFVKYKRDELQLLFG